MNDLPVQLERNTVTVVKGLRPDWPAACIVCGTPDELETVKVQGNPWSPDTKACASCLAVAESQEWLGRSMARYFFPVLVLFVAAALLLFGHGPYYASWWGGLLAGYAVWGYISVKWVRSKAKAQNMVMVDGLPLSRNILVEFKKGEKSCRVVFATDQAAEAFFALNEDKEIKKKKEIKRGSAVNDMSRKQLARHCAAQYAKKLFAGLLDEAPSLLMNQWSKALQSLSKQDLLRLADNHQELGAFLISLPETHSARRAWSEAVLELRRLQYILENHGSPKERHRDRWWDILEELPYDQVMEAAASEEARRLLLPD